MATSGSRDFSVTRLDIIQAALRKVGAYDSQETLGAAEQADAAFALNVLLKEWAARGIDIFVRSELTLFLEGGGKSLYSLGPTGDHATLETPVVTALTSTVSGPAAATVIVSVTDTTGMATGGNIGIKLDDNTVHWTTISTVNSSTTVTIALSSDTTASSGQPVYSYTNKAPRPISALYAMRRDLNGIDVPVDLIGDVEYQRLNRKSQDGPTTSVYFKATLDDAELRIWPTGGNNADYDQIIMQANFYAEDMDSSADEPSFPIEWANAIIFNLAHDLAPEYGVAREERIDLFTIGQGKLKELLDHNVENANVVITLDQRATGAR